MPFSEFKNLDKTTQAAAQEKLASLIQANALQAYYSVEIMGGHLVLIENPHNRPPQIHQEPFNHMLDKLALRNAIEHKQVGVTHRNSSTRGFLIKNIDIAALNQYNPDRVSKPSHIDKHTWSSMPEHVKECWHELSANLQTYVCSCLEKKLAAQIEALTASVVLGGISVQSPVLQEVPSIPIFLPNATLEGGHSNEVYDLAEVLQFSKGEDPITRNRFALNQIIPAPERLQLIEERLAQYEQKAGATAQAAMPVLNTKETLAIFQHMLARVKLTNHYRAYLNQDGSVGIRESSQKKPNSIQKIMFLSLIENLQDKKMLHFIQHDMDVSADNGTNFSVPSYQFTNIDISRISNTLASLTQPLAKHTAPENLDSIHRLINKIQQQALHSLKAVVYAQEMTFQDIVSEGQLMEKIAQYKNFDELKSYCENIPNTQRFGPTVSPVINAIKQANNIESLSKKLESLLTPQATNTPAPQPPQGGSSMR